MLSLRSVIVAGAIALGCNALGGVPIAAAEPEWDIEAYDQCLVDTPGHYAYCCYISGGVKGRDPGSCTAPAALQQDPALGPDQGRDATGLPLPPPDAIQPRPGANSG